MSEINVTSESTQAATGSITDQISALLMEDSAPEPKKESKIPESKPDLPPSEDSMEEDSNEEGEDSEEVSDKDESDESDEIIEEDVTWAKALGIDEDKAILDDNGEFAGVKVKVDGKVSVVPITDLISGYQSNKSNANKSKAIAEERKQLEVQKQTILNEYATKVKDAEALNNYLEQSITKEFSNIDWNNLRYSNPGEYAALVQDYNIRMEEVNKIKLAINTVNDSENFRINQEQAGNVEAYVRDQIEQAIINNPEWADTKKFKEALTSMQSFIGDTYGFSPQEFSEVRDARMLEIIKDAQKYRQGKQVAEKKLEKPIAKFQKSISAKKATVTTLDKLTKRAKEAQGYNKRGAETEAVAELLKGIY